MLTETQASPGTLSSELTHEVVVGWGEGVRGVANSVWVGQAFLELQASTESVTWEPKLSLLPFPQLSHWIPH